MSLPIIQNVILTGTSEDNCKPLKAPNFNIDVDFTQGQSTTFETYDDILLVSSSITTEQLVKKYLSDNFGKIEDLHIDYSNPSNFVKYSSLVERLANFRYKKELSESYDNMLSVLSGSTITSLQNQYNSIYTKKTNLIN